MHTLSHMQGIISSPLSFPSCSMTTRTMLHDTHNGITNSLHHGLDFILTSVLQMGIEAHTPFQVQVLLGSRRPQRRPHNLSHVLVHVGGLAVFKRGVLVEIVVKDLLRHAYSEKKEKSEKRISCVAMESQNAQRGLRVHGQFYYYIFSDIYQ